MQLDLSALPVIYNNITFVFFNPLWCSTEFLPYSYYSLASFEVTKIFFDSNNESDNYFVLIIKTF